MKHTLEAICTGTARPFNGAEASAIAKYPREGTVQFLEDGLAPDEQADRRVHGGPDMAVHLYPLDHHDYWREELGALDILDSPGAFGSNLAVRGMTENDVHIGDTFRVGSSATGTLLQISQPRKPCWKIEHRFGQKGMVAKIVKSARSGWYFRVLELGEAQAGDAIERVELGDTDWSVARAFNTLMTGKVDRDELAKAAELPSLSADIRSKVREFLTADPGAD